MDGSGPGEGFGPDGSSSSGPSECAGAGVVSCTGLGTGFSARFGPGTGTGSVGGSGAGAGSSPGSGVVAGAGSGPGSLLTGSGLVLEAGSRFGLWRRLGSGLGRQRRTSAYERRQGEEKFRESRIFFFFSHQSSLLRVSLGP